MRLRNRTAAFWMGLVCGLGLVGMTLLSLVSDRTWYFALEWLSHFKLQYAVLGVIFFLPLLFLRQKYLIWFGLLCLSIHTTFILPWYIPSFGTVVEGGRSLDVWVFNLNQDNRNYAEVLQLLQSERPDIAVLVEADRTWSQKIDSLREIFPYSVGQDSLGSYGNLLYSQIPLKNAENRAFGVPNNPSLVADLDWEGQPLHLIATHFSAPFNRARFQQRNRQLIAIGQYVNQLDAAVVMMGDLNISMWSPYYGKFTRQTELYNARDGFGLRPTWPTPDADAYYPIPSPLAFLLSIPIDHILVSPEINVETIRVGPNLNSDHYPLMARLWLTP